WVYGMLLSQFGFAVCIIIIIIKIIIKNDIIKTQKIETIISRSRKVKNSNNQNKNSKLVSPKVNCINEISDGNIVEVVGDGNCFFRCISQHYNGNQESHKGIRNQIIRTMKNNRNFYEAYIEGSFENHITNMARCSGNLLSWATDAEIMATSEHYKIDVFVRSKIGQTWNWYRYSIYENCEHSRGFITIQHENNHYNLIVNINRPCRCMNIIHGTNAGYLTNLPKNSSTRFSSNINSIKPKVMESNKIISSRKQLKNSGRSNLNIITLQGNVKENNDKKGKHTTSNGIDLISININGMNEVGKQNQIINFMKYNLT
ncbi:MAG: hypothetical protein AAGM46_27940, partial [Cyanobacteria bacterium J06582_2]